MSYFGYPVSGFLANNNGPPIDLDRINEMMRRLQLVPEERTPLQELTERVWADSDETDGSLPEGVELPCAGEPV